MPDYSMTYADRSRVGYAEEEFLQPYNYNTHNYTHIDGGSRKMAKLHMQVIGAASVDDMDKIISDYQHELETSLCVVHANALLAGRMIRSFKKQDSNSALAKNINMVKAVCATFVSRNGVDHKDIARQFNVARIARKDIDKVMDVLKRDPVMREEMDNVEKMNVSCCDDDEIRAIMGIVFPSTDLSNQRFKLTKECIDIAHRARVFPGLMGTQQKQLAATVVYHVCNTNKHPISDSVINAFINPATLKKKQGLLKECLK